MIVGAVCYEQGNLDSADFLLAVETIQNEQLRRKKRIMNLRQRRNGKVRRQQHEAADSKFLRHLDCHSRPQRVAIQNNVSRLNTARDQLLNAGSSIVVEADLGRLSWQAAVSAKFDCEESVPRSDVRLCHLCRTGEGIAIAVKKDDCEIPGCGRRIPSLQLQPVSRCYRNLEKSLVGRRREVNVRREVEQASLCKVERH